MKFDTRDKKPKVFSLLIVAAVEAAFVAVLCLKEGGERNEALISATLAAAFLAAVIILAVSFFRQLQYNPYSYNTIYYSGFSLFFLSLAITFAVLAVNQNNAPLQYRIGHSLQILLSSAVNFMYLSAPFILLFSAALCISNISLIRHEGRRLVNVLGIILSFLLVGGEAFLFLFNRYVTGNTDQVMIHDLILNLVAACYLYFECMLIGAIIADIIAAKGTPDLPRDFLIILGCGIRKDGTPTPILKGRIDRAIAFYQKQKEETGKELIFVTSGGQGRDEVISESACMKQYLLALGIPEEQIIEEDRSASTFENMKYSKEKIQEVNPEGRVTFSTTNYHVFRGGLYARRVKMRAVGMGAETKWYFWPNASVREFVGLLTEHRLKQGLIFGSLIVVYVGLTLVEYLATA